MDGVTLLGRARAAGIEIRAHGEQLHVRGPKRHEALVKALFEHKEAILALLELYEERAAIMEYCAGLPREDAERQAWAIVLMEPDPKTGPHTPDGAEAWRCVGCAT